jgi:hypothetical protein
MIPQGGGRRAIQTFPCNLLTVSDYSHLQPWSNQDIPLQNTCNSNCSRFMHFLLQYSSYSSKIPAGGREARHLGHSDFHNFLASLKYYALKSSACLDNLSSNNKMALSFAVSSRGVRLSPLGTSAADWPTAPSTTVLYCTTKCATFVGMRIGRGNRITGVKSARVPLCPPEIPLRLTCDQTRASAMGSSPLTA